jgi:hypothetical protein
MKVTGYQLREAIRRHELRRDAAATQFNESLWRFEDEDKISPDDLHTLFVEAEKTIGVLQVGQMRYNRAVALNVTGEKMTLAEGVKRIGGAGRIEKMWRESVGKKDRYGRDPSDRTRSSDTQHVVRALSVKECMDRTSRTAKFAGALRAAIAEANSREVEVEGLDPSLFE